MSFLLPHHYYIRWNRKWPFLVYLSGFVFDHLLHRERERERKKGREKEWERERVEREKEREREYNAIIALIKLMVKSCKLLSKVTFQPVSSFHTVIKQGQKLIIRRKEFFCEILNNLRS